MKGFIQQANKLCSFWLLKILFNKRTNSNFVQMATALFNKQTNSQLVPPTVERFTQLGE